MIEEMWMIRPQRRSFMPGAKARVRAMQLVRFSSTRRSQSSSRIWSIGLGEVGAGVVDEDIDLAQGHDGGVGQAEDVVAPGHVGDDVLDAGAAGAGRFPRRRPQFVFVAAGNHQAAPALGEDRRHRLAEALAAAGDQGHAAGQIEQRAQRAFGFHGIPRLSDDVQEDRPNRQCLTRP